MISAGPLGFSLPSALTNVARTAYRTASDPRVQATAAVVGQEYAPDTTAQVQQYARNVNRNIRAARQIINPDGSLQPVQPMVMMPDDYGAGGGLPVQKSNMLVYAGIGAAALVLLLLLKK